MGEFRPLGEEQLHSGHVIDLYRSRFETPDGSEIVRDVVRHPGAVSVVPVLDSGEVVLVRQFRAPLNRRMLEIPAGKLDVEGEDLEDAAQRELAEEVGLVAENLEKLATFHNSVGFSDEESHVFVATGLKEVGRDRQGPEEQHMDEVRMPLADTPAAMQAGEITDAKTVIGLLMARERLSAR
ncbi:MAG: NUDIX hydrolase [Actinomycetia bacterium]|nr:NUDIX hydrolase [Actinomycetes bacterium]